MTLSTAPWEDLVVSPRYVESALEARPNVVFDGLPGTLAIDVLTASPGGGYSLVGGGVYVRDREAGGRYVCEVTPDRSWLWRIERSAMAEGAPVPGPSVRSSLPAGPVVPSAVVPSVQAPIYIAGALVLLLILSRKA